MNYSLRKPVALLFSIFTILLTACSDESPVESATDNIEEVADEVERHAYDEVQELERESKSSSSSQSLYSQCTSNYNSTCCNSCYSDYGYYNCEYCTNSCYDNYGNYVCGISSSSSYYYSSSSEDVSIYTYKPSTITLMITYFEQTSSDWDIQGGYSDGDPRIHFIVKSYSDGILQDSVKTDVANLGDNVGTWSGKTYLSAPLSGGIDEVLVFPIVIDNELATDDYSSGYGYYIHNVGQKIGESISQDDYLNDDCILKWNAIIDYN